MSWEFYQIYIYCLYLDLITFIIYFRFDQEVQHKKSNTIIQFLVTLSVAAAERDSTSGEGLFELLSLVCRCYFFPYKNYADNDATQSDFLLDLYLHAQACEAETAKSLLSTLKQIYHLVPAVWSIDLSEGKASIFLEVVKLQTQKKPVELRGWSDEESEVRSFLQCLPYISQLRSVKCLIHSWGVICPEHLNWSVFIMFMSWPDYIHPFLLDLISTWYIKSQAQYSSSWWISVYQQLNVTQPQERVSLRSYHLSAATSLFLLRTFMMMRRRLMPFGVISC